MKKPTRQDIATNKPKAVLNMAFDIPLVKISCCMAGVALLTLLKRVMKLLVVPSNPRRIEMMVNSII